MASGDLTTGTQTIVDVNDDVTIASTIDAINLATATDTLFILPINNGSKLKIFKVERAA